MQEVQVLPGCDGIAAYRTVVHLQAAMIAAYGTVVQEVQVVQVFPGWRVLHLRYFPMYICWTSGP